MKPDEIARLFQVLADPVRLTILVVLAEGERGIDDLAALTRTPRGQVSAHLRLMRTQGWVESRREGTYAYYRIADERVLALVALARELATEAGPTDGPPAIVLGFHHVFKGWIPFEQRFWTEVGRTIEKNGVWPGIVLLAFAYLWAVVVRGGYKKSIGEPFIRETTRQTWIKMLLYVPIPIALVSGIMLLIEEDFGQLNNPWMLAVGTPFFVWGLICVTAFRVVAQVNQRRALVQQMAAVVLPAHLPDVRIKVLTKILNALCEMPEQQRLFYMKGMQEAISQAPEPVRDVMTRDRLTCLAELPSERRRIVMMSMDKILLGTP